MPTTAVPTRSERPSEDDSLERLRRLNERLERQLIALCV